MNSLFKKSLFKKSLFNNSIKTKIALIVSLFVFITAILVGWVFYIGGNNYIVERELETLEHHLKERGLLLSTHLQAPREDILFLAATPPIEGIIRAIQSKGGIDPLDGSSKNQWLSRLAEIFKEMLAAKPAYLQIRFIGKEKELVRVQNLDGISFMEPEKILQNMSERAYFIESVKLEEREIYMSDIELNREFGELTLPYLPVIKISTPVFDSQGKFFGVVVVNIDFTFVLTKVLGKSDLRSEIDAGRSEFYITSDKGDFLVHPDDKKSFGFEFGKRHLIQDLYPVYRDLIESNGANEIVAYSKQRGQAIFEVGGIEKVAYFYKSYFDPEFSQRFLGMAMVVNYDEVVSGSYAIRNKSILLVMLLIMTAVIFATLIARMTTGNLMRIINVAEEFTKGKREFDLPIDSIDSRDEIGVLARILQKVMDQVQSRDEALRESEARFSEIIELAGEGIISLDEEQKIILFNMGAETIFGYKKEEVIGKSVEFLLPEAVRKQHKHYVQDFAALKHPSRTMFNIAGLFGVRKNGKSFPMEASISNLSINDKTIYTVVVRDIYEQVRAQEELLTIKQNLSDAQQIAKMGSYLWTIDNGVMEWSDELYQILDYKKGVHIPTLSKITNRVYKDDRLLFDETLERVFALDKSVDVRFRIVLPNGSVRSTLMSFRFRDKNVNNARTVTGTIQDVSGQIKTVEEKLALEKQLQQFQKKDAIGQLTDGIAHDFNNILASIMGYTNLAQERFSQDNPTLEDYLNEVYRAGERARDLISLMLTSSHSNEPNSHSNEPKILEVQPLIKDAMRMPKSTMPSSISVTTDYVKGLPKIMQDPVQNKSDDDPQHILIVDDESSVAGFLRELFETRGYKVTVEIDSVKALNIFKNNPGMFDIVITDQTMPKLTGAELSKEILSIRSDMPIVLCTGYSEVIDETKAFKIGINEYLTKPIDSLKLCNAVSRLSDRIKSAI